MMTNSPEKQVMCVCSARRDVCYIKLQFTTDICTSGNVTKGEI